MSERRVDPSDPMPRYYQLYTSLLARIQASDVQPGTQLPTERQLGEEYGVSRITVIKALDLLEQDGYVERQQGRGTFVSTPRERVRVPEERHFAAPVAAVTLRFAGINYVGEVIHGIADAMSQHGYPLHVYGLVNSNQDEIDALREALAHGAQGLIVYPWTDYLNGDLYEQIRQMGVPLVQIDRYYPQLVADSVTWADQQATYQLTSLLIQQGHRRIAFVPATEIRSSTLRNRIAGYRQALEAYGLPFVDDLVWMDLAAAVFPSTIERSADVSLVTILAEHLTFTDPPTALVAVNYDIAEPLLAALQTLRATEGLPTEVLNRLAVAAISHVKPAPGVPFLTAVALQRGQELGTAAADLLIRRLQKQVAPEPQQIELPMPVIEFVLQGETAPMLQVKRTAS